MTTFQFSIRLTSDAEPGTGLGGDVVNDWAPRDHLQRLVLPASHIKGLMRASWQTLAKVRGWPEDLEARVFGAPNASRPGLDSTFRLTPAVASKASRTKFVTRTAQGEAGVAKDTSLRTSEAIPIDTEFVGELHSGSAPGSAEDLAWRLAMLSIPAIGGGRNRGCGECVVSLAGDRQTPGELLKALELKLRSPAPTRHAIPVGVFNSFRSDIVVLKLVFRATSPICCPEAPDKTNVMATGFSIPASAVQGVILNRINSSHPDLASAMFASPQFRCWPLQPCGSPTEVDSVHELPTSIRVSLTHRAAKYSLSNDRKEDDFF